jgi:hypothetical protein
LKKQSILTSFISGVLVTLALSQASYSNESSMSQQKTGNDVANSHLLSVQAKTNKLAMFVQHGKSHKPSTGKKGKKA